MLSNVSLCHPHVSKDNLVNTLYDCLLNMSNVSYACCLWSLIYLAYSTLYLYHVLLAISIIIFNTSYNFYCNNFVKMILERKQSRKSVDKGSQQWSNSRCCCNETPPTIRWNLDFFTHTFGKSAKLFTRKLCQVYAVWNPRGVCTVITSPCWSHRIATSFAGVLHDWDFL